jgi:hypothetical protein
MRNDADDCKVRAWATGCLQREGAPWEQQQGGQRMQAFLMKMTGLLHQVWRGSQPFHLSRPFLLLTTSTGEVALSFTRWRRMNGEAEPSRKQAVVEPNAQ